MACADALNSLTDSVYSTLFACCVACWRPDVFEGIDRGFNLCQCLAVRKRSNTLRKFGNAPRRFSQFSLDAAGPEFIQFHHIAFRSVDLREMSDIV